MTVKELIEELNKMPQEAIVEMVIPWGWENVESEPSSVELTKEGNVKLI
jgi:hypothetical protein